MKLLMMILAAIACLAGCGSDHMAEPQNVYIVDIEYYDPATATTGVLRYATEPGFRTAATDTPPRFTYIPRVSDPGNIKLNCFSNRTTGGEGTISNGEMVLRNVDGKLDAILKYAYGRAYTVRSGPVTATSLAEFSPVHSGIVEQPTSSFSEIRFRIRDAMEELEVPILSTKYAGTGGQEGDSSLSNTYRPRAFGYASNITPVMVSSSKSIYQYSSSGNMYAVMDSGIYLTRSGPDYTSWDDMDTNPPAAGCFRVWPGGGMFRLGGQATGRVTCHHETQIAAQNLTVSQLVIAVLNATTQGAALVAANKVQIDPFFDTLIAEGYYVTDGSTTQRQVLATIAANNNAWCTRDANGVLLFRRIIDPASLETTLYLDQSNVTSIEKVATNDDSKGVPIWSVEVSTWKNWTVMSDSDVPGVVPGGRTFYTLEYRYPAVRTDASVLAAYPNAKVLKRVLSFNGSPSYLFTESNNILNLHKIPRDLYRVTVKALPSVLQNAKGGAGALLTWPRFGLDNGKKLVVYGIDYKLAKRQLILDVWG